MILTTTSTLENTGIACYLGIVTGECVIGANIMKDFFASIRDIIGGRSSSYERVLNQAKEDAMKDMTERARALGADAVIGIDIDYETIGGSMLMVSVSGTAAKTM